MTHAEWSGAKARDRTPGLERLRNGLGAVEHLQPVADRIGEHDQIFHAALIGKRARAALDLYRGFFQTRRQRVESGGIDDFPAIERGTLLGAGMHDHALLAIIHAQGKRSAGLLDKLHAEKARAVGRPLIEIGGADADIAEGLQLHVRVSRSGKLPYHAEAGAK